MGIDHPDIPRKNKLKIPGFPDTAVACKSKPDNSYLPHGFGAGPAPETTVKLLLICYPTRSLGVRLNTGA